MLKLHVFLKQVTGLEKSVGDATFKFEPFVLHVQCKELGDAQLLVNVTLNQNETSGCLEENKIITCFSWFVPSSAHCCNKLWPQEFWYNCGKERQDHHGKMQTVLCAFSALNTTEMCLLYRRYAAHIVLRFLSATKGTSSPLTSTLISSSELRTRRWMKILKEQRGIQ